jgi:hypothetical protein
MSARSYTVDQDSRSWTVTAQHSGRNLSPQFVIITGNSGGNQFHTYPGNRYTPTQWRKSPGGEILTVIIGIRGACSMALGDWRGIGTAVDP